MSLPLAVIEKHEDRERHAPIDLTADRRCAACGYGIASERTPERCPMCGGAEWAARAASPSLAVSE